MDIPDFPQPTGRLAEIIDTASHLLESHGWAQLSTRALAKALGIKAPSLYKHVSGKDEIAALLSAGALLEMGTALHQVLDSGGDAEAMLARYRALALTRPNHYRLVTSDEFSRRLLPEGLEEWAGTPFYRAAGEDSIRAQALWAFAHGMAILEIDQRFAPKGTPAEGVWAAGARALSRAKRDYPEWPAELP